MRHMLSTVDNPYNPFTHYDAWWAFDHDLGYHTPSYLDRVAYTSDEISEADQEDAIETAIKIIIAEDPLELYVSIPETQ